MIKKLKFVIVIAAVVLLFFLGYWLETINRQEKISDSGMENVVLYGTLRHFSGSGSMKFYYVDLEKNQFIKSEEHPWFWANIGGDSKDEFQERLNYISANGEAVFKITGKKNDEDCGYTEGVCYEDITVDEIEVVRNVFVPSDSVLKFEDYKATESFNGTPAKPNFNTNPAARMFYTRITKDSNKGPNFAGAYAIITYGCGTSCQLHTIVNENTGKIVSYNEILSEAGIRYQLNSRLIIVNPPESIGYAPKSTRIQYYYLSEDGSKIIELVDKNTSPALGK